MTYYLYDARGYVGDLASNYGLKLMSDYAIKVTNHRLRSFLKKGIHPSLKNLLLASKRFIA